MKKILLILFLLSIPVLLLASEPVRIWKSQSGKTIEAMFDVARDSDPATVPLISNGKKYKIPFDKLSQSDQDYVTKVRDSSGDDFEIDDSANENSRGINVVPSGKRYALLIGVDEYAKPIKSLKFCVKDMELLASCFQKAGMPKGNIILVTDDSSVELRPTAGNIRRQIKTVTSIMEPDDQLVVAFSGHGVMLDGKSYLCPSDTDLNDINSIVSRDWVFEQLEECKAKQKVFIIDACRNEITMNGEKALGQAKALEDPIGANTHGFILIASCDKKQKSWEHPEIQHGVFTYFLAQGLSGAAKNEEGYVTIMSLFQYTSSKTKMFVFHKFNEAQVPTFQQGGEMTDFCLASAVSAEEKSDDSFTPDNQSAGHSADDNEEKYDSIAAPVRFTDVHVSDAFWQPRLKTACNVTVPDCFMKCEDTRIPNFARAAGMEPGPFRGIYFDDSDVYKIIEGAAYVLALEKNEDLDKYVDSVIEKIAGAQEDDGYLYTSRTIFQKYPQYKPVYTPPGGWERWSNTGGHELYCAGHMYEAAVAHYIATGKRNFLDVAIKNANLICDTFGVGKKQNWPPGHQEIEIGLVKLYRLTGDKKYLDQAKYFLDIRGRSEGRTYPMYGAYNQDHQPVVEQTEAIGHAVRAAYMYCGMADVAAMTGDESYVKAINAIWKNVVGSKLYVTGGIGSTRHGEAFEGSYIMPNDTAYCETCANIANVYWNHRMFLWTGASKYIDVLERSLYNSVLSGINLDGDHYFYPNVLDDPKGRDRSAWFGCSCCPSNLSRFLPSMPGYMYAVKDDCVYINLYAQSEATLKDVTVDGKPADVKIKVETKYPWDGAVKVTVLTDGDYTVKARIPGWAVGEAVPEVDGGHLHSFINFDKSQQPTCDADGKDVKQETGYFVLSGTWKAGDSFTLNFPMQTLHVVTDERVKADVGLSCIQRGPLVYCVEAQDCIVKETGKAPNSLHALVLADDALLSTEFRSDLLNGVMTVKGTLKECVQDNNGTVTTRDVDCVAIPYYSWANRGVSPMSVYFPRTVRAATPNASRED